MDIHDTYPIIDLSLTAIQKNVLLKTPLISSVMIATKRLLVLQKKISLFHPMIHHAIVKWYHHAIVKSMKYDSADEKYMYFLPRTSSHHEYVTTAVVPIRNKHNKMLGVLNSNYNCHLIQDAFNHLKILGSGYVFLIDKTNASNIIIHPHASSECNRVECAEKFSDQTDDYKHFKERVLDPIQFSTPPSNTYMKNGNLWWLKCTDVGFEKEIYTLIAVVPYNEVDQASQKTDKSIKQAVTAMIIVFVISTAGFLVFFLFFVQKLIAFIVHPVADLRELCMLIKNDDLDVQIPTESTSLDMKVLLSAFSGLVIALRFGSDSYARGNNKRARAVFSDALQLFESIANQRGIGASMNNLAAVELCDGNYERAEDLYFKSIENAEEQLAAEKSDAMMIKLKRVISDRKGN